MTQGKPMKTIISFAIPVLFGNILQNLYSMADTAIVGRTISTDALAAVGATGAIFGFFVCVISGLMGGIATITGRKYGAYDFAGLKKVYINGLIVTFLISALCTVFGIIYTEDLLRIMNTPEDIISMSADYLKIIFGGISTTMLYNFAGEMLRATGDSKRPFLYLVIASILNIIFDFVFILGFGWGIKGAAFATVLSQAISAVLCFSYIVRTVGYLRFGIKELKPDMGTLKECMKIGVPMSFLSGTILLGVMILQFVTNGLGTEYVAANSGSSTIANFLLYPIYAFGASLSVFTSQNYGAGNISRIKDGAKYTILMFFAVYAVFSTIVFFSSEWILAAIYGYDKETAESAALLLNVKAVAIFALVPLSMYKSVLQALGRPLFPTISGFLEIAVRFVVAIEFTKMFGIWGIALTDPLTWVITGIFFIIAYRFEIRKVEKKAEQNLTENTDNR